MGCGPSPGKVTSRTIACVAGKFTPKPRAVVATTRRDSPLVKERRTEFPAVRRSSGRDKLAAPRNRLSHSADIIAILPESLSKPFGKRTQEPPCLVHSGSYQPGCRSPLPCRRSGQARNVLSEGRIPLSSVDDVARVEPVLCPRSLPHRRGKQDRSWRLRQRRLVIKYSRTGPRLGLAMRWASSTQTAVTENTQP